MRPDAGAEMPDILAIFNNVAPGREAEFEEWFQHEHLAERIGIPGFLIGRRHEAVTGLPRYFNFYVTRSAKVLNSAACGGRGRRVGSAQNRSRCEQRGFG